MTESDTQRGDDPRLADGGTATMCDGCREATGSHPIEVQDGSETLSYCDVRCFARAIVECSDVYQFPLGWLREIADG